MPLTILIFYVTGALAIGITCNFVNNNTIEEAGVPEISGISYQYNPKFFNDMEAEYGVKLENIVYYKDETHYFVMTALKSSLLNLGAIREVRTVNVYQHVFKISRGVFL